MTLENYQKLIQRKNEIDILQNQIVNEISEFFEEKDIRINNVRLYADNILIQTNYSKLSLHFLKLLEKEYGCEADIEIIYDTLAIRLHLQQ